MRSSGRWYADPYIVREEWSYCREVVYLNFTLKKTVELKSPEIGFYPPRPGTVVPTYHSLREDTVFLLEKNKIHSPNREEKFYSWPAKRQLFLARLA